jgi:hypothetical protein
MYRLPIGLSTLITMILVTISVAETLPERDFAAQLHFSDADRQGLLKFRLTADLLTRIAAFNDEGESLLKNDTEFKEEWEREGATETKEDVSLLQRTIQNIRGRPHVEALLRAHNLAADEYVIAAYTILFCNWTISPDSEAEKTTSTYIPLENVKFFIRNRAKAVAILERTPAF